MYNHIFKDIKLRKTFKKFEKKRLIYKYLSSDFSKSFFERCFFRYKLLKLSKKVKTTRLKNYCLITGRSRSVLRNFKVARMPLKTMLNLGFFSGYRRASW